MSVLAQGCSRMNLNRCGDGCDGLSARPAGKEDANPASEVQQCRVGLAQPSQAAFLFAQAGTAGTLHGLARGAGAPDA